MHVSHVKYKFKHLFKIFTDDLQNYNFFENYTSIFILINNENLQHWTE